jgi:hypothetical protein
LRGEGIEKHELRDIERLKEQKDTKELINSLRNKDAEK